ncbi:MAG: RNA polymerase sigma factor [Candidatus Omnitrophica bacterium]|nr:RNA polymerase sigma factor [Candidatus Omnitrophota bacterium]
MHPASDPAEQNDPSRVIPDEETQHIEVCLQKAREGDLEAFERFYLTYKGRIFNYLYRFLGDYHASEELTQEVFIKAYKNLKRYEARMTPLAWIYTIARNSCKNWFRARALRSHISLDAPAPQEGGSLGELLPAQGESPEEEATRQEEEGLLKASILSLPAPFREVVILCDIQGCDYRQAAVILGTTTGTIGSRLFRARTLLAEQLRKVADRERRKKP